MLTKPLLPYGENNTPVIMGILNVTPDSFSDGGKFISKNAALRQAECMLNEGAEILDIGGESTRPGSNPVPAEEQIRRVIPVIRAIRQSFAQAVISIDTTSATVAAAALEAGAAMINDVSAGLNDPEILNLAAQSNSPIILMHSQGQPKTMQDNPYYADVASEVTDFLEQRSNAALNCGIKRENIIIDPGIGFGKRKQDNLDLLANLEKIAALGYPVMLGASRKRFMGSILEVNNPAELVTATAVTTALGVMAGVSYFRVHDVLPNAQAAAVAWAIRQRRRS